MHTHASPYDPAAVLARAAGSDHTGVSIPVHVQKSGASLVVHGGGSTDLADERGQLSLAGVQRLTSGQITTRGGQRVSDVSASCARARAVRV